MLLLHAMLHAYLMFCGCKLLSIWYTSLFPSLMISRISHHPFIHSNFQVLARLNYTSVPFHVSVLPRLRRLQGPPAFVAVFIIRIEEVDPQRRWCFEQCYNCCSCSSDKPDYWK